MRNARLGELQAGIKIGGRNINNLRYADDTTLTAESEEELKNLLMRVKEESERVGLKLNIKKTKTMAPGPITSWRIEGENINNLRFADDITLMAESKEELKSLLMRVKEESERAGLRLNIKNLRSWLLAPLLHGK